MSEQQQPISDETQQILRSLTKRKRVYLASRYTRKMEIRKVACILMLHGYEISSSWIEEPHAPTTRSQDLLQEDREKYARQDLEDIRNSDAFILFTEGEGAPGSGRHFEAGYAYALGIPMITVGPRENIFHYLPDIKNVPWVV
jgi:nucleoside 2-deoxyribosyltransferase